MFRYAVFEKVNRWEYVILAIRMTKVQAQNYVSELDEQYDDVEYLISPTELREIPKDIFTPIYPTDYYYGK